MKIIDNPIIDYLEQEGKYPVGITEEGLEKILSNPEETKQWKLTGVSERVCEILSKVKQGTSVEEIKKIYETVEYDYIYKAVYTKYVLESGKYYELGYSTTEEFCKEVLKHSYEQERKNIRAAEIAIALLEAGFDILPANVNQGYLLYKARLSRKELIKFWRELLEHTQGLSPTTKQIQEKLYYRLENVEKKPSLKLSKTALIVLKQIGDKFKISDLNEVVLFLHDLCEVLAPEIIKHIHRSSNDSEEENRENKSLENTSEVNHARETKTSEEVITHWSEEEEKREEKETRELEEKEEEKKEEVSREKEKEKEREIIKNERNDILRENETLEEVEGKNNKYQEKEEKEKSENEVTAVGKNEKIIEQEIKKIINDWIREKTGIYISDKFWIVREHETGKNMWILYVSPEYKERLVKETEDEIDKLLKERCMEALKFVAKNRIELDYKVEEKTGNSVITSSEIINMVKGKLEG